MKPVTVTQLNEYIAQKLRSDYRLKQLPVEGEISSVNISGRTRYITLKDQGSIIKCVIWESNSNKVDLSLLELGNKVVVVGDISPYPKGGYYSFSITHIESAGEGALMAEFNRIKKTLEAEGLFDRKWKKPIPEFPLRVGIITSEAGAAIEDVKKIITSKNNLTDILIFPTIVQGSQAPMSIVHNIELANRLASQGMRIDTLIVGRGGGSQEDLAAFNEESVARAIFASEIPIISAVGHESDVSISDFVADLRAETPTAAANLAVMNTFELSEQVEELRTMLLRLMKARISSEKNILSSRREVLISNAKLKLTNARNSIDKTLILLQENHPEKILSKGYAIVTDEKEHIIQDAQSAQIGKDYILRMRDGSLVASIINKHVDKHIDSE